MRARRRRCAWRLCLAGPGIFFRPKKMLAGGHRDGPSGLGSIPACRVRRAAEGVAMSAPQRVGAVADLPTGKVVGAGHYAVGNADGRYFAVTRRCRHLGADLAGGSIDQDGCLVCPWHRSAYDVRTGRMVRGPQGIFAKVPGLDFGYRMLTRVLPLGRAAVTERDGELYIAG